MTCDFRQGKCDLFDVHQSKQVLYDEENGAQFVIGNYSDAPTLLSNAYLLFGIIELEMKASPGTGVATTFAVQSDVLDEVCNFSYASCFGSRLTDSEAIF